jgi:uncharacterized repeat protein (TIGR01451 family)
MRYLTLILVLFVLCTGDRSQAQTVQLKLGDYTLSGAASPKKEGSSLEFLQASFSKSAKNQKGFGLWYAVSENAMSDVILEITDASSKSVIRKVTASDLLGKGKSETLSNGSHLVSTYQFGSGPGLVELQVDYSAVADESAPLGKKLLISYKLRTAKSSVVDAVLNLKSEGDIQKLGASGFGVTRMENGQPAFPSIVVSSLSSVNTEVASRSNGFQQVSIQVMNVTTKEKAWSSLFSFEAVGTTVKSTEKTVDQANRIVNRVSIKEAKPDLAIFNTASPTSTVPGDTVTYVITYCNIGNALAQNAEITNPVPDGVRLLENSVENSGANVVIERKPAVAPEVGAPTLVRWQITKNILPGEEGKVTMKVVVR